ncbi:MAG: ATP-binding protein [Ilumatobacteraceae bacterium]
MLVANELVTNALRYTPGPCRLCGWITTTGGGLRGEVSDTLARPLPPTAPTEPSSTRGRGLLIVDQRVSRWGVDLRPPSAKVVWFEIDPGS